MSTRSRIAVMHGDKFKSVYVHSDGYLSGVGSILLEHYDSARANHLVALGDISSLGTEIEAPEGVDCSFDGRAPDVTVFYGRTEYIVAHTFEEFLENVNDSHGEYYYVMKDGEWYCGTPNPDDELLGNKLVPLAKALTWEAIAR